MAGLYKQAVLKVACPKCFASVGRHCIEKTSSVVHPARRALAIKEGHWSVELAWALYNRGELAGEPLEALKEC